MKKNMRRSFAIAVMALFTMAMFASCLKVGNGGNVLFDGKLEYTDGDLTQKDFAEIDLETLADVYYVQSNGDKQQVRVDYSAVKDPELRAKFEKNLLLVYRDNKLIIGSKGKLSTKGKMGPGNCPRIYVTSPDLIKVTVEGVGSFYSDAINSDVFQIDNEGVGNVNVKNLLANKVDIDNEGVGHVTVSNLQADNVEVDNEGVGSVTLSRFKGGDIKISNDGVGKVIAHVDCRLVNASLDGVGSIRLSGVTKKLTKQKDGVGAIVVSELKVMDR